LHLNTLGAELGVGIIGCGWVANAYANDIQSYPEIDLRGAFDLDSARAAAFAAKFRCSAHRSLDALIRRKDIDAVVNLTPPHAHAATTTACLLAGKHVYSEKPLALTYDDARSLVELAQGRKLRLASAPCTLLGEAQQTAENVIRDERLGMIRVVFAEANGGRIERWHPAPESLYAAGPMYDIAVYPLALITAWLGPARRVRAAAGDFLGLDRKTTEGRTVDVRSPDFVVAVIDLEGGVTIRLTASFYLSRHGRNHASVELHGDRGTLRLADWQRFDAAVELSASDEDPVAVPLLSAPEREVEYGRGLRDLAQAVIDDRTPVASGDHAAHVVETIEAVTRSIQLEAPVQIDSGFSAPVLSNWINADSPQGLGATQRTAAHEDSA
jgi:predicted dehydrogenase